MHSFTFRDLILFMVIAFGLVACQDNPATPGMDPSLSTHGTRSNNTGQAHYCSGYSALIIDKENMKVEVLPMRSEEWHLNLVGILNSITWGVSAVGIPAESDPTHGLFVFDVTLKHPFPTKTQFAGFDVKGILMTPGTLAIGSLMFADVDETRLENADGYTRWWNPSEFTSPGMFGYTQGTLANVPGSALWATVNPYKYFADALWADSAMTLVYAEPTDSDKGRGVFTAGKSNTRRYRIRFPMDPGPKIAYGYAVDVAWGAPSPNPPTQVPDDFPIEANQPEAYYLTAQETVNTLYYDSETGYSGGVLRLQINVHDWQGQLVGNIHDQVGDVRVYSPWLFSGGVDGTYQNEINIKAYYAADLTGTAVPIASGRTLVAVRASSNGGPGYDQGVGPAPAGDISAWDTLEVTVQDPDCMADANDDFPDALEVGVGEFITDQLCVPDDFKDYYYFEIPSGYVALGDVALWCDASTGKLELYDSNQVLVTETMLSGGNATIQLDSFDLMPGQYYLRVYSYDTSHPTPYLLENTARLKNVTPSDVVEITPNDLFLEAENVIFDGDYVYLAGYRGFWIYDVSDPSAPVQVSRLDDGIGTRVVKHGNYIYSVAYPEVNKAQLDMVDVTDPSSPIHYENLVYWGYEVMGICVNSEQIFIGSNNPGPNATIRVYDYVADPLHPSLAGSFDSSYSNSNRLDLIDPEGPATILVVGHGFRITSHSVEDLSNVLKMGDYACDAASDLKVKGDKVYVAGSGMGITHGLFILQQTQIQGLVEVGVADTPGSAWNIDVEGNYAVIGDGMYGLSVCDITDPANPVYWANEWLIADGRDVDAEGTTACIIAEGAGFELIDVSTLASPVSLYATSVVNSPSSVHLIDDYLIVSENGSSRHAVITLDVSDPENANVVSECELYPIVPEFMVLGPDGLGAAGGEKDWTGIDASDPMNVSMKGDWVMLNEIDALGLDGDTLYVANDTNLAIFDIDPLPATYKNQVIMAVSIYTMSFTDDYMYMSSAGGIEIYSIVNPYAPASVGTYAVPANPWETIVRGDYLYITENDRLEIADISSPGAPVFAGTEFITTAPYVLISMALDGQFAYLGGLAPVSACNVWPPDNPTLYGEVTEPVYALDMLINDGVLYLAGNTVGLQIYNLY